MPFSGRPFRGGGGGGRRRGAFLGVCAFFLFLPFFLALATFTNLDFPGALSVEIGRGSEKKRGLCVVCSASFRILHDLCMALFISIGIFRFASRLRILKHTLHKAYEYPSFFLKVVFSKVLE